MRRMERRRAEREGTAPRTLQEIDFLLLVDDEARQGALRFAEREADRFCAKRASSASRLWSNSRDCSLRRNTSWRKRTLKRICACCLRRIIARRRTSEGVCD